MGVTKGLDQSPSIRPPVGRSLTSRPAPNLRQVLEPAWAAETTPPMPRAAELE
jgi:hypothetical protein